MTGGPWQPQYHLSTGHTAATASPRERPRPGCTHTPPSQRPLTPTRGPRADRRLAKAPRPPVAQCCPLSPRPVPGRPRAGEAQPTKARRLTWGHTQAGASGPSIRAAPHDKSTSSAASSGDPGHSRGRPAPSTGQLPPSRAPPTGDPELPLCNSGAPLPVAPRMLCWLGPHEDRPGLSVLQLPSPGPLNTAQAAPH